jgi:hypothetical protein
VGAGAARARRPAARVLPMGGWVRLATGPAREGHALLAAQASASAAHCSRL